MMTADFCTHNQVRVFAGGVVYKSNTEYFDCNDRCHDCGILNQPGNAHHPGL